MRPSPRTYARLFWGGFALGVAADGLLDGAVLHQTLGWHHFLSARTADPGVNMVADGLFHLAMLAILALGLTMLWQERVHLAPVGTGRRILAAMLIGAGSFQVFDSVVDHWLFGLHHIYPPQRVLSDLLFFAMGLALIGAGRALTRVKPVNAALEARRNVKQSARR